MATTCCHWEVFGNVFFDQPEMFCTKQRAADYQFLRKNHFRMLAIGGGGIIVRGIKLLLKRPPSRQMLFSDPGENTEIC